MAYDATWINELDEATPAGTETRTLGDNAIREIKKVLKETFPEAVTGQALTVPFATLNALATQGIPRDTIIAWAGDTELNPDGPDPDQWTVCDGRARSGGGTAPDLVSLFLLGAKTSTSVSPPDLAPDVGATGGNSETDIATILGTSIAFTTQGTELTEEQIPPHRHYVASNQEAGSPGVPLSASNALSYKDDTRGNDLEYELRSSVDAGAANIGRTSATGGTDGEAVAHTHNFTIRSTPGVTTGSNVPPFYAVVYLIKE